MPKILTQDAIEDFRERIIDAAEQLFAEHGAEAVTIRQLAAAIGVSPMTPYRYFADKDAILAAVRTRGFTRHAQALEIAFAAAGADPRDGRAAILEAYITFAERHPAAYRLMFDVDPSQAARHPELREAGSRSFRTMTLGLDVQMAGASPAEIEFVGHLYWAAIHGPLMLQLTGMLAAGPTGRDLIAALVSALNQRLAQEAPSGQP